MKKILLTLTLILNSLCIQIDRTMWSRYASQAFCISCPRLFLLFFHLQRLWKVVTRVCANGLTTRLDDSIFLPRIVLCILRYQMWPLNAKLTIAYDVPYHICEINESGDGKALCRRLWWTRESRLVLGSTGVEIFKLFTPNRTFHINSLYLAHRIFDDDRWWQK